MNRQFAHAKELGPGPIHLSKMENMDKKETPLAHDTAALARDSKHAEVDETM